MNVFSSYSIIRSIRSYNYSNISDAFNQSSSFIYICTSFNGYIVVDFSSSRVIKLDKNFNFISYFSWYPAQFIISVNNSNTNEIFISNKNGVYKLNIFLTLTASYYRQSYPDTFQGLYYNQTGDYILACSNSYYIEFLRRDDLTFIKYISIYPYFPTDIREFNGTLFVGTKDSTVIVLNNEVISFYFNTKCTSITSIAIDIFGNIAVICSPFIHLYSINGTYLNVTWTSSFGNITSIGFDGFGNFVLTAYDGIYIFH